MKVKTAAILSLAVYFGEQQIAAASTIDLCKDPVTVDTKLEADLECSCRGGHHLVDVKDGAILDLNGYTVKCSGGTRAKSCIHLDGFGATVVNGGVYNCKIGVHLDGIGSHHVFGVTVEESGKGMYIQRHSDANLVVGNTVYAEGIGIQVVGDFADLRQNTVISKNDDGIEIDNNTRNLKLRLNTVLEAKKACIRVHGDDMEIEGNDVHFCGEDGIRFRGDSANVIVSFNRVSKCEGNGFYIEGGRVVVSENTVSEAGGNGIELRRSADDPRVLDNFISGTTKDGVKVVDGDNAAVLVGNTITHSGGHGINVEGKPAKAVRDNKVFNCAGGRIGIKLEKDALDFRTNIVSQCG